MNQALPGSVKPPLNRSHGRNRGMVPTKIANESEIAPTTDARMKELAGMDPSVYQSIYGDPNAIWRQAMGLGLGSSGSGPSSSDTLARDKFNYDKRQDALTRATALEELQFARGRDARIAGGYSDFYDGGQGQYNQGFGNLLSKITDQGAISGGDIGKAYTRAITGINEGYDSAQGVGDAGFRALNTYLGANPNNPYANMRAQVGSAPDAMSQYLGAYGVSDMPVQGQIRADELQSQQDAGNFQNLIDVLSGVAQQGAASRGAESQMAQNFFNTTLGQDRAGYRGQAENAQATALAALQQRIFDSQFSVEQDRNSLANQLAEKILDLGGDINNFDGFEDPTLKETDPGVKETDPGGSNTGTDTGPTYKPALQTLVNKIPALKNPALVKRIETFAKKNPNATKAQLRKVFPNLVKKKK